MEPFRDYLASKLKALEVPIDQRNEILAAYNESLAVLSVDLAIGNDELKQFGGALTHKERAIKLQFAESIWPYLKVDQLADRPFMGEARRYTLFIAKSEAIPWFKRK